MQTIALASLSLASKSTESPRRLRELLFPAHRFLNPSAELLKAPSGLYDTLRATLVQAELMLLRVLGFNLRIPLPLDFLPRYLERALGGIANMGEDYGRWTNEERDEYGVVGDVMDTRIGRACRSEVVDACKDFQFANYFPPRATAVACLYVVFGAKGLHVRGIAERWVYDITSGKVDKEDFDEIVAALRKPQEGREVT